MCTENNIGKRTHLCGVSAFTVSSSDLVPPWMTLCSQSHRNCLIQIAFCICYLIPLPFHVHHLIFVYCYLIPLLFHVHWQMTLFGFHIVLPRPPSFWCLLLDFCIVLPCPPSFSGLWLLYIVTSFPFFFMPIASPLLTKLHWLPIAQRIEYKISSVCCYVVSETAPPYLSDLLHMYIPSCSLYSSADTCTFRIPKGKKQFQGQRTFPHLGPGT